VSQPPIVVERVDTPRGELVLRQVDNDYEIISNGIFLMDTRDGASERLLVSAALAATATPASVLIGGLGMGISLLAALADPGIQRVTVVEIEPTIMAWHRTHLADRTQAAFNDPRADIVIADIVDHLRESTKSYDAICLDVDNGPDWTVTTGNQRLYDDDGTALLASRLTPGGVLAIWSASRPSSYEGVLASHFSSVDVHEVAVARGDPDVILIAAGPRVGVGTS
jgi:spermidine synthase